jgi:hemerythrin-like domain-containing protein
LNDIDKIYSNINEVCKPMCEKDGRIKRFVKLLEKEGFVVQEGSLEYTDMLKLISEGKPAQLCFSSL